MAPHSDKPKALNTRESLYALNHKWLRSDKTTAGVDHFMHYIVSCQTETMERQGNTWIVLYVIECIGLHTYTGSRWVCP
jgi:hypothetical protein